MSKHLQHVLLFVTDFVTIQLAFYTWAGMRQSMGHFIEPDPQQFFINASIIFAFWFLGFVFWGLYHSWHAHSRVDEVIAIIKVVTIGVFLIFLITFDLSTDVENPLPASRAIMISYWFLMIAYVSTGRMLLRTFQRTLLEAGIGERKALIVGWGEKARTLFDEIRNFPALGYRLIGFIDPSDPPARDSYHGCSVVGSLPHLGHLVEQEDIDELLLAIDGDDHQNVLKTLFQCSTKKVKIKTIPSLYDIAAGQARTHQIYGLPLIEVMSEPMPTWESSVKRIIDLSVATVVLVLSIPFWLRVFFTRDSTGGRYTFVRQKRVGKDFRIFDLYALQWQPGNAAGSAEEQPAPAARSALVRFGLQTIPPFLNVFKGDLSLIGPRAERVELAEALQKDVQLYHRRSAVRPGLIGWAQLKGDTGEALEKIKRTLQYDFFYIENMSLRMDLKILLVAVYSKLFDRRN